MTHFHQIAWPDMRLTAETLDPNNTDMEAPKLPPPRRVPDPTKGYWLVTGVRPSSDCPELWGWFETEEQANRQAGSWSRSEITIVFTVHRPAARYSAVVQVEKTTKFGNRWR